MDKTPLKREHTLPRFRWGVPGTKPHYPFDDMEVGDWFVIPSERSDQHSMKATLWRRHQRKPGRLFGVVQLEDQRWIVMRVE